MSSDDAPELKVGDSGEGVVMLQVRLYQLKLYRQMPDGTFDMTTENAVRELQSQVGQDNSGEVTSETWDAILHVEQQYGIQYQYASPYDALDQLQYDLQNPSQASGNFPAGDPALSEDGQWRWDGNDWQPAAGADSVGGAVGQGPGQLSEDGQWRWDGTDWQPASGGGAGSADPQAGQLSEDGQWRWDGSQWQAAGGDGYSDGYSGQLSEDGQWRWDGSQWQAA